MNNIKIAERFINEYKLNVLPTNPKEKSPAGKSWKEFESRFSTESEIEEKFKYVDLESVKMGIICGNISGGLEVLDFDNKIGNAEEILRVFSELPGVNELTNKCPLEKTQSGGFHIYYRSGAIDGNQKLALQSNTSDDKGNPKYECVIETRGEGGFCK
jgi:hypothetical protein